jgi:hypothetical protein
MLSPPPEVPWESWVCVWHYENWIALLLILVVGGFLGLTFNLFRVKKK